MVLLMPDAVADVAVGDRGHDRALTAREWPSRPRPADDERSEHVQVADIGPDRAANQSIAPAWIVSPTVTSGRSPIRSARAPATGATTMNVPVQAISRTPAPSGLSPTTTWSSCP